MPFERIVDSKNSDSASAELLRVARTDGPSEASRARILSNLDSALSAGALATIGATSVGLSASSATSGATRGFLKWLAIVGVGVSLPIAGVFGWRAVNSPAEPPSKPTVVRVAPQVALPSTPSVAVREEAPAPTIKTVDVAELPVADNARSLPAAEAARPKEPSLAEELRAIQRARLAVSRGDANAGLRELDAYRAEFPRGRLMPEAAVLRIEALMLRGDRAAAKTLADRFIAANPQSAYAARIKSLLGSDAQR